MTKSTLELNYDGICLYATLKVGTSKVANTILIGLNVLLASAIVIFLIEAVPAAAIAFALLAIFLVKYTLWNIFGEERLVINTKTVSVQHHYGFFTTALQTFAFNQRLSIVPFDNTPTGDENYLKFLIQSYHPENDLPSILFESALNLGETDYQKFVKYTNRLFTDELSKTYELPAFHLN
jgi:hypothetical protein